MKGISLLARWAAIPIIALPSLATAADIGQSRVHRPHAVSKEQYCLDCHGRSAEGWRGYYPIPRLAGQTSEYIENQMQAFAEGTREARTAIDMAKVHEASPALWASLSARLEAIQAPPADGGPGRLVDEGKKIFSSGIPEANVPACAACHGPEAKGSGSNPRLAGQLYPYLVKELVNWSKERAQGSEAEETMAPIAHSLTKPQIEAVSAYVSRLR